MLIVFLLIIPLETSINEIYFYRGSKKREKRSRKSLNDIKLHFQSHKVTKTRLPCELFSIRQFPKNDLWIYGLLAIADFSICSRQSQKMAF
jgi:hypothetical protein